MKVLPSALNTFFLTTHVHSPNLAHNDRRRQGVFMKKQGVSVSTDNTLFFNSKKLNTSPDIIRKRIRYYLGKKYPRTYLTTQEAKCLYSLVKNFTSKKTAILMGINFRTVEYYRESIRCKLGPISKEDLLAKIKETNFLDYTRHLNKLCRKSFRRLRKNKNF